MPFNLKKFQSKTKTVLPISTELQNNVKKYDLSLEGEDVVSLGSMLNTSHGSSEGLFQTHEAMLDSKRKENASPEKIIEGSLENADSDLFPHRQFKDKEDLYQVAPINVLSEGFDRKYRDAFSKVNKKSDTDFWDKYVSDQLDIKPTKVPMNINKDHSQLSNNPERFKNFVNLPVDEDPIKNRNKMSPVIEIQSMPGSHVNKNPKEILSSINAMDRVLFSVYADSALQKRELNQEEKEIIASINKHKSEALLSLAQLEEEPPVKMEPEDLIKNTPSARLTDQPFESDSVGDFNDGNPTVSGDELYWANESGFNPQSQPPSQSPSSLQSADMAGAEEYEVPDFNDTIPSADMNDGSFVNQPLRPVGDDF
jgi:hypothetical protein